ILFLLTGLLTACGEGSSGSPASPVTAPASTPTPNPAQTTTASTSVIRIYSSLPLTGSGRSLSESMVNAMRMAVEDFTQGTNRLASFTIEYVPQDDAIPMKGQWDADQEKANATKAVNDPDGLLYLGTYNSGAAKVSIPILNAGGMAMVSPSNTYPGLTKS